MWVMMDYFIDFAAFEPTERYIPGAGNVALNRGEWAFTERELSEFFGVDRQRIRTCLKKLKSKPFINPTTNPKYTLIKVINYETYQTQDCESNPKIPRKLTSNKPTPNPKPDSTIIKELKNKETNGDVKRSRRQLPPDFYLSTELKEFAAKNGCNGDRVETVFAQFCDYHRAKGNTMLDWSAAWRTWIRNDKKFSARQSYNKYDQVPINTSQEKHRLNEQLRKIQEREKYMKGEL